MACSIAVVVVCVYSQIIAANIAHIKNGREPDAGVSLVGYVIFPLVFLGSAYLGNAVKQHLGFYIVFILFGVFVLYAAVALPRQKKIYNALQKSRPKC